MHAGRTGAFWYRSICQHVDANQCSRRWLSHSKEAYIRNISTFILAAQHLTPTLAAQHLTPTLAAQHLTGMPTEVCLMFRDRERSIAAFHAALQELQRSSLLPRCNIHVTVADDLAGTDLMSVATDAVTAVGMIEKYMEVNASGHSWQGTIELSA